MGKELRHFRLHWEEDVPTSIAYKSWGSANDYWLAPKKVRIYKAYICVSIKDAGEYLLKLTQHPDPKAPAELETYDVLLALHDKTNGPRTIVVEWTPGRDGDYIELSEKEGIGFVRHIVSGTGATITAGFEVQAVFYYEEVGR